MDDAIQWLETVAGSRFFLWAHLYDPHRPYDPPEPYRSRYAHNPYIGEIAFADAQIGRLIGALEQQRLLDRTVVIVTADHGEALGSHGERDHGIFVYEDVIRIPLIIRAPGLNATRIGQIVRVTDIMPTVLDLLGAPETPTDGVSLVDVMRGRKSDLNLEAYAESLYPLRRGWSPLRALRSGRFKLIDAPRPELYDLDDDPFEERNIYDRRRGTADAIATRLQEIATARTPAAPARPDATPDLQARLGALGYLATSTRGASDRESLPDPKDCIGQLDEATTIPVLGLNCGHSPQRTSVLRSR
jgi:arylsulfatase A-like enzyme